MQKDYVGFHHPLLFLVCTQGGAKSEEVLAETTGKGCQVTLAAVALSSLWWLVDTVFHTRQLGPATRLFSKPI